MRKFIILFTTAALLSCEQSSTKVAELEDKEKELALRENKLVIKENELNLDSKDEYNSAIEKQSKLTEKYNYKNHNNIETFIADLSKAINSNDKLAIAKMTYFPFGDGFRKFITGDEGIAPKNIPDLFCKNQKELEAKFTLIFTESIQRAIKNKKYRGCDNSDEDFEDIIEEGEFIISGDYQRDRPYEIAIKKINGVFKLHRMAFGS